MCIIQFNGFPKNAIFIYPFNFFLLSVNRLYYDNTVKYAVTTTSQKAYQRLCFMHIIIKNFMQNNHHLLLYFNKIGYIFKSTQYVDFPKNKSVATDPFMSHVLPLLISPLADQVLILLFTASDIIKLITSKRPDTEY